MRQLLFVLMIALLLLRGWMGDAMANDMALASLQHPHQPQQSTPKKIAAHAHAAGAEVHFDHESAMPGAAQAAHHCAEHAAQSAAPLADGHCPSCDACQDCHSVALAPAGIGTNHVFDSRTLPRTAVAHFASAEAALGQKPPIS